MATGSADGMSAPEPRVPLLPRRGAPDELRAVYDAVAADRGGAVGNVFRALGSHPPLLRAVAEVGGALRRCDRIDPVLRECVILAVADVRRCRYEWTHHIHALRGLGETDDQIRAHLAAPDEGFGSRPDARSDDERTRRALAVARAMAAGEVVSGDDISWLRRDLGDEAVIELVVTAAYYLCLSSVIDALAVPLERGITPEHLPDE